MKSKTPRSSRETARPTPAPKTPKSASARALLGTEATVQRLMHELEVHHVELEAQNTELRSSRDEAERVSDRYAELFDCAPLGYVVLDVMGRIREANLEGSRMLGVSRASLAGMSFASFIAEEQRPAAARFIGALLGEPSGAGVGDVLEATMPLPTGPIEVRLSATALSDDEPRLLVAMFDVSEAKRAARVLRDEARRKDEFLAVLAHELRNPLAPIRTSVALLARLHLPDEGARSATAIIDRQASHLARIVDDLLDVSRITRDKIHLQRQRLDLREVVRGTVEDHRPEFDARGVMVECSTGADELWIDADRTRVAQITGNLLGNALKFTPRGGHVRVETGRADGGAQLQVCDDGAGIAADVREQLFRPFVQASQTLDRTRGGLGLGLAMVRGLVELHGGKVEASSRGPGLGADFVVWLPLVAPPPALAPPGPGRGRKTAKRRILVVEDNVDSAEALEQLLLFDGHDIRVAHDGPTALALARAFHPEVVLCDIGLPDMDGYEIARALRADTSLGEPSMIALSGYARAEDRKRALDAGFDGHLAKPPSLERLEEMLAEPPHLERAAP